MKKKTFNVLKSYFFLGNLSFNFTIFFFFWKWPRNYFFSCKICWLHKSCLLLWLTSRTELSNWALGLSSRTELSDWALGLGSRTGQDLYVELDQFDISASSLGLLSLLSVCTYKTLRCQSQNKFDMIIK